jgi:hypothetical protein
MLAMIVTTRRRKRREYLFCTVVCETDMASLENHYYASATVEQPTSHKIICAAVLCIGRAPFLRSFVIEPSCIFELNDIGTL